ncbi:hypothetical protein L1887_58139 [Cichorium endivia]|nr:hypothetical protein L1887_58139 [Cichorium endivia]
MNRAASDAGSDDRSRRARTCLFGGSHKVYRTNQAPSRPSAKQSHETCTGHHLDDADRELGERRGADPLVEDELVGEQFDRAGVQQDTGRDRVKGAGHVVGGGRVAVVGVADAEADGEADGGDQAVGETADDGNPRSHLERQECQTGAETETLKHLVEDDDDEEHRKVGGGAERDADDDRVEDDAELEDEHADDLRCLR